MLNNVSLMGRLTRDADLRYTQSNTPVASFTIAVDRDFSNKSSGERECDFIPCVAWRGTGEFISKYFQKGSMIVVNGRLQMREYTDKQGQKRTVAEVVVDNAYFGGRKQEAAQSATVGANRTSGGFTDLDADEFDDGDLPFK